MKLIRELLPPRAGALWRQLQLVGACIGTFAIGYAAISGAAYYFEYLAGSSSSERAEHVNDCATLIQDLKNTPANSPWHVYDTLSKTLSKMEMCALALAYAEQK